MPAQPTDDLTPAQREAVEAADEAAETLGAGKGVDPLDALLDMEERAESFTDTFDVRLMSGAVVPFTVKALTGPEIDAIRDRCTRWVRRGRGAKVQELDTGEMNALLVVSACQSPDWKDARLKKKYGKTHPHEVVSVALLPGQLDGIASRILETSGYTDDLVSLGKP